MENRIIPTPYFESQLKRFLKKHLTLSAELKILEEELLNHPDSGTNLGSGLYKIRLASGSKGKGKGGGFRIVTYLVRKTEAGIDIYLITIFDKSEESSVDKSELKKLVKRII